MGCNGYKTSWTRNGRKRNMGKMRPKAKMRNPRRKAEGLRPMEVLRKDKSEEYGKAIDNGLPFIVHFWIEVQ